MLYPTGLLGPTQLPDTIPIPGSSFPRWPYPFPAIGPLPLHWVCGVSRLSSLVGVADANVYSELLARLLLQFDG